MEKDGTMNIIKNENSAKPSGVQFTTRQKEIVRAWAKYPTIAQASAAMDISEHTFQTHLRRLRRKIQVNRTFDVYEYMKQKELL